MFSDIRLEERVPADHPLRAIRVLTDAVLSAFDCARDAACRATLLQAFFALRSERQLMEQIDCNLLFRWFVGLPIERVRQNRCPLLSDTLYMGGGGSENGPGDRFFDDGRDG